MVAKGVSRQAGTKFWEIYAALIKYTKLRLILVFVVQRRLKMHEVGGNSSIVNGELQKDFLVVHPEDFVTKGQERVVLRLHKLLVALRQAASA